MSTRLFCILILAFMCHTVMAAPIPYPFQGRTFFLPLRLEISFQDGEFSYVNQWEEFGNNPPSPPGYPTTMSGPYEIRKVEGFTVATVRFPTDVRELYLFYLSNQLIIYDTELERSFWAQESRGDGMGLFPVVGVEASSYFTEILGGKEVRYVAENLTDFSITNQWVEGVAGYGEGEKLLVRRGADHVVVLNGFFAPRQPTLYLDNGRLKRVLVRGFDETGSIAFEEFYTIPDKPNLYTIQFPLLVDSYEIEIVEVYPGRRFEDTAISGLFFDGRRHQEMLVRELGD